MNNTLKYYKNPQEVTKDAEKICLWLGSDKEILELGCHSGYFSSWLNKNNCKVTGIEINANALQEASPYLKKSICGNLEDPEIWNNFEKESFDAILLMHILEHLINPEKILKKSLEFLKKDGTVIIGLPNVSNAKDRFNMFFGKFEYTEIGVLDNTHLRFFNQKTARKLIFNAGLVIEEYFSSWRVNPVKHFFDHIPFLWRLGKKMKDIPTKIYKFSPNITDVIMLYKCCLKKNQR